MRTTIVPAQVTTVEDRIAGNLGMTQVVLLVMPLFLYFGVKFLIPAFNHMTGLKVGIWVAVSLIIAASAIRIKGTLMLFRVTTMIRFMFRPRYYLFDKHSSFGRTQYLGPEALIEGEKDVVSDTVRKEFNLSTAEVANLEDMLRNPAANVSFDFTKGGLRVRLTEIKEASE